MEETKEAKQEETKQDEAQEAKQEETPKQKIELPPVNFTNFVNDLASAAFGYLGGFRNPETGTPIVSLELAKHHIDTIEMLQEKTRGNLTAPEGNFLENILYNLRMSYVRMSSAPPPTPEPEEQKQEEQEEKQGQQQQADNKEEKPSEK